MARSTELGERMAKLEKDIEYIKISVDDLRTLVSDNIKNQEEKFASKWVETGAKWIIGLILSAVITAVLALVIYKPF